MSQPAYAPTVKLTPCSVPGCTESSPDAKFICRRHLAAVDPGVRRTAESARRAVRSDPSLFNYRAFFAAWRRMEEQAVARAGQ
jgi:hypothetical protein